EAPAGQSADTERGRGGERLPICLAAETVHVIAHLARVCLQSCRTHVFLRSILRVAKLLEPRVCVDAELLPSRKTHDEIGPEPAVVSLQGRLFVEVAPLQH